MKQALFFEQAGVGLPREEFIRITTAMRELVEKWPIETLRFWGKILGTRKNYYVVEAEFKDGEYESDLSDDEGDEDKSSNDKVNLHCWCTSQRGFSFYPLDLGSALQFMPLQLNYLSIKRTRNFHISLDEKIGSSFKLTLYLMNIQGCIMLYLIKRN